jgi:Primase C terminal 2 (PriCT-2)
MKLSVKYSPIGKGDGATLTHNWQAVDWSQVQVLEHARTMPYAVAQFKGGHRHTKNFIHSSFIAVDVDGNGERPLTTAEYNSLLHDPFITSQAFGVLQTASSKPDAYKCRVMFELPEIIAYTTEYKQLVTLIQSKIPFADPAAKDAARAFFGGCGLPADFVGYGNLLDLNTARADNAILQAEKERQRQAAAERAQQYEPLSASDQLTRVGEALQYISPDVPYDTWLKVLMGLASLGADGLALAERWTGHNSAPGELAQKFASFTKNEVTIGTVFHYAKENGWQPPRREKKSTPKLKRKSTATAGIKSAPKPSIKLPDGVKVVMINEEFGTNAKIDYPSTGVIVLKGDRGTGKSEMIERLTKDKQRVYSASHRVTLVSEQCRRFDLEHYQNIPDNSYLRMLSRIGITPNSTPYLRDPQTGKLPTYEAVVLDEISQLLRFLFSRVFLGASGLVAYTHIVSLIQHTPLVIVADADMGEIEMNWLANIRPDIFYVENTYRKQRGDMTALDTSEGLDMRLLETMKLAKAAGQPTVICSDSRAETKRIDLMLQEVGYNGLTIHGDNSQQTDIQDAIKDITAAMEGKDYLIYSPSLGTGVDYQGDVYAVFAYLKNRSLTANDQHQLIARARRATRFFVFSQSSRDDSADDIEDDLWEVDSHTDPAELKRLVLENNRTNLLAFKITDHYTLRADGSIGLSEIDESFLNLWAATQAKYNAEMKDANTVRTAFILRAKEEYNLTFENRTENEHARDAAKGQKERVKAAEVKLMLESSPIDDKGLAAARKDRSYTKETEWGHRRWKLESFWGLPIDEELIKEWENGGASKTITFIDYYRKTDELIAFDKQEHDVGIPVHKRQLKASKFEAIRAMTKAIFGEHLHYELIPEDEMEERLELFESYYIAYEVDKLFKRHGRRSGDSLARLRWVLGLMGLRLNLVRVGKGDNERKFYQLDEERYVIMRDLAASHLAASKQVAGLPHCFLYIHGANLRPNADTSGLDCFLGGD